MRPGLLHGVILALTLAVAAPLAAEPACRCVSVKSMALPDHLDWNDWDYSGREIINADPYRDEACTYVFPDGEFKRDERPCIQEAVDVMFTGPDRLSFIRGGSRVVEYGVGEWQRTQVWSVGEGRDVGGPLRAGGIYWLYEYPELIALSTETGETFTFAEGYYPATIDGSRVYFISADDDYNLERIDFRDGEAKRATVIPGPVFFPQVAPGAAGIVIQDGSRRPRIALLDDNGKRVRNLSGDGRWAAFPLVSPGLPLVAFVHCEDTDDRAHVVEVVTLDGDLVYQALIGEQLIPAGYRWSTDGRSLACILMRAGTGPTLEIATFEAVEPQPSDAEPDGSDKEVTP